MGDPRRRPCGIHEGVVMEKQNMELAGWYTRRRQTAVPAPFRARKAMKLAQTPVSCQALVCGLGQFLFYCNGNKVSDHELDPAWTDYRKSAEYVTFDLGDLVRAGTNVFGIEVGNGWYHKNDEGYTFRFPAFMPPNPNPYRPFGSDLVFAVKLVLTYADGTREERTADETWLCAPCPVTQSNVYGSETIDLSLEEAEQGWLAADFAPDARWAPVQPARGPAGRLVAASAPPVKVLRAYPAVYLRTVNGRDIYDIGQNTISMLELWVRGGSGDRILIRPAEKLNAEGDIDQVAKNWCTVDSVIQIFPSGSGSWQKARMKFTYAAGRYFSIEKLSADGAHGPAVRDFRADAVSAAWKEAGTFCCDDARYQKIYEMIERTVEANLVGVHTDCPTIERFAWQEPNHLMAPSIFFMKDGSALWRKFFRDLREAQHTASDTFLDFAGNRIPAGEGLVPSQAPCYIPNVLPVPGLGSFYDIVAWGSTIILGPWWHYRFYKEREVLEENFDAGMAYLDYLKGRRTAEGFLCHGLGDWGNPTQFLARENVETAFLYADAKTLAGMARVLGREDDAEALDCFAQTVRDNYNQRLLVRDPQTGKYLYRAYDHPGEIAYSQGTEALPLYWGMVPEAARADVEDAFRRVLTAQNAFVAGEITLPYIIQTAWRLGMDDQIAACVVREKHPSYYAFLLDGETTLGEYWESNPRSHCHDMLGHIVEWYYQGIAGIVSEEPGFGKIRVTPYLPAGMHAFACSYQAVSGTIHVEVRENDDEIRLKVRADGQIQYTADASKLERAGKRVITV